ncbi:DUF3131 domain-containing protein [Oceanomicrobium pacificus]|uniref:DUF3131 domain-containing protein n=1 Tax=Oceanomicrobium pacificus TaxID=2692916 RepID=A0A6B0TS50_9RHOB|nr:DUF3131 domain-containing protein [Oceanomicrobium pacificus]MXU64635.1 DUF3131 domain-containing protein [Oceanomicrobium pacificus]
MSFRDGLLRARGQITFITGLLLAVAVVFAIEAGSRTLPSYLSAQPEIALRDDPLPLPAPAPLSARDREAAARAWRYFEANIQPDTGLANAADGYPSATLWDQGSFLLGLVAAERLGLIDRASFDARAAQALDSLARMPLFDGKLPNKAFDTRTLAMTDYDNSPAPEGIGWSAIDVARISVVLNVLLYDYPQHAASASAVLASWDLPAMLHGGQLIGTRRAEDGSIEYVQEGRLGYEEYAARAVALLGLDALTALRVDDYLKLVEISGEEIAVDSRSHLLYDAHTYVVSEPYLLTGVEFGFDQTSRELAERVYRAQLGRYTETGILTAVNEDNVDEPPYFVYNTVYADGQAWNALGEDGSPQDALRAVSTKAAFGWEALYQTDYGALLRDHVEPTATEYGFASGIYERNGAVNSVVTANTNGIILELLLYKAEGPLIAGRFGRRGAPD